MTNVSVNETCRCGATFGASGYALDVGYRHKKFHEQHAGCRTPEPGMCGNPSAFLVRDNERTTALCQLRAGHAGFHEDGQGCSWGHPTWTTTAAGS